MIPSWWVPVKWPSVSGLSPATSLPLKPAPPTSVSPIGFGFTPFAFTNRPTAPLIGAYGKRPDIRPTETAKNLTLAKTALGALKTLTTVVQSSLTLAAAAGAQAASAAAQSISQAVPVVSSAIGVVTGALSLAQVGEAKTRAERETLAQSGGTAILSAIPGAGLAALGASIPAAIEGMVDAANAKKRAAFAKKNFPKVYDDIRAMIPKVVSASDRLDEFYLLPKGSKMQIIAWCAAAVDAANLALTNGALLSPRIQNVENGEAIIGVPGRDVSQLRALYANGVRDALILYFAARDVCARLGNPIGASWPLGKDGTLRGLAGPAGFAAGDLDPIRQGAIPGAIRQVEIGATSGNAVGNAPVPVSPALTQISDMVSLPGWSLWALLQYFDHVPGLNFRASDYYKRVAATRALNTVLIFPTVTPMPVIPDPATVTASVAATQQAAQEQAVAGAQQEALRVELFYEQQRSNTA